MCKKSSAGRDSVRNRTYNKVTVYLGLQCVLLLEAIILLHIEHKNKDHLYSNSEELFAAQKNDTLRGIDGFLKEMTELKSSIDKTMKQQHQLKKQEKELHKMDGWTCHQSHLYYVSSEMKNWTDSEQDCGNRNATLMNINSNEFFDSNTEVWIGLTKHNEGNWKWTDGKELNTGFISWRPGEPTGGNCALLHSSELDAFPCSDTFKWICEKKKES